MKRKANQTDGAAAVLQPWRFIATAASIPWQLIVDAPSGAKHACEAALALVPLEALLESIDEWCKLADQARPHWAWAPSSPLAVPDLQVPHTSATGANTNPFDDGPERAVVDAVVDNGVAWASWQGPESTRGLLGVPWPVLRRLGAPRAPLSSWLQWRAPRAVCVFDRFELDAHEIDCLEPGGAVVLPCSLQTPWIVRLCAHGEGDADGLPVQLAEQGGVFGARTAAGAGAPNAIQARASAAASHVSMPPVAPEFWEVRSSSAVTLPLEQLAGWTEPRDLPSALFTQPALTGPRPDDERVRAPGAMPGTLIPWGRGRALWLQAH
jgi:hypothetical protein